MLKTGVDRLMAGRVDINTIIGLSVMMCAMVASVVSFSAIHQAQADVRPLAWHCGTVVVLAVLAVLNVRYGAKPRR